MFTAIRTSRLGQGRPSTTASTSARSVRIRRRSIMAVRPIETRPDHRIESAGGRPSVKRQLRLQIGASHDEMALVARTDAPIGVRPHSGLKLRPRRIRARSRHHFPSAPVLERKVVRDQAPRWSSPRPDFDGVPPRSATQPFRNFRWLAHAFLRRPSWPLFLANGPPLAFASPISRKPHL